MSARARIGLAGWGTVGGAVATRLAERLPGAELVAALVRDPGRHLDEARRVGGAVVLTTDPDELIRAGCDVVVECTGDVPVALRLARATLTRGDAFVTANKQCLAVHGAELAALAEGSRGALAVEAAVGGGMPVVSLLLHALRADRPRRLAAVVNGTTNLVLDRMAIGDTLEAALAVARREGLAEADASADVEAHDPVAKLVILAALLWRGWARPEAVHRRGIRDLTPADLGVARALGYAVRLVAQAESAAGDGPDADVEVALGVEPTLVPRGHPLAEVEGAGNAIVLDSDLAGRTVLTGTGAGGVPTASAVLSDLARVLADRGAGRTPSPVPHGPSLRVADAARRTAAAVWRVAPAGGRAGDRTALAQAVRAAGLEPLRIAEADQLPGLADGEWVVVTAAATAARRSAAADALALRPDGYAVRCCLPMLEP